MQLASAGKHSMAVLTNKPVVFSKAILDGLGLSHYFRFVYGGNSFATKKPDPIGVEILLRDFAAAPRESMMIGDSDVDVRTARNAGIWSCGVSYGLGMEGMRAHPPDFMLDSLTELPDVFARHCSVNEATTVADVPHHFFYFFAYADLYHCQVRSRPTSKSTDGL